MRAGESGPKWICCGLKLSKKGDFSHWKEVLKWRLWYCLLGRMECECGFERLEQFMGQVTSVKVVDRDEVSIFREPFFCEIHNYGFYYKKS